MHEASGANAIQSPDPLSPLVLTLAIDPAAQADFEQQRRRYFPATLNRIPAHITLFHALPGEQTEAIRDRLRALAGSLEAFPVRVFDVLKLGRGVGYALEAAPLAALHAELRQAWLPWLTRQDAQGFRPHVVVQNKVDASEARALYDRLAASFRPYAVSATGLLLWRYLGGPWSLIEQFPFGQG
jgi:2'-5' RNA ligase